MTRNSLIFGGVNSADYNVWISGADSYSAPERDVEVVSVPGRNGDLIIDNGKWNNISITYPAFIPKGFENQFNYFRSAICRKTGYQRLEDTYHPDEYRMARLAGGLSPSKVGAFLRNGDFSLTFNCKPQRFLKIGDEPVQILIPFVSAGKIESHYIPAYEDGKLDFEIHCVPTDTLTVVVKEYDSTGTETDSTSFTCSNGDTESVDTIEDRYYRILVSGISFASYIDETYVRVQMIAKYENAPVEVNAVLARSWWLTNPTGYYAKPMIEMYAKRVPYFAIRNYVNGEEKDFYSFYSSETTADRLYLDCDLQYMYDDDRTNLTNYLTLTNAISAVGEGLVFPRLGEADIWLYIYAQTIVPSIDDGMGLVCVYPKWWRL